MKQVFISDLHLSPNDPKLTHAFIEFLAHVCMDADELYILGDFFDVWLGDDDTTDFSEVIIHALRQVPARTFIMHGNRDFLLGDDFCKAAGAELLKEPTVLEISGRCVLLMHGDSLCTRDTAYMKARVQLRDAEFQRQFLAKSLGERAAIAQQIRGESLNLTRETAADIMDVTPEEVFKVMRQHNAPLFIHGHTHRPAVHEVIEDDQHLGRRFVLGDWQQETRYAEIIDGAEALLTYRFA